MNIDLDKLEQVARAATPGPWAWDGRTVDPDDGYVHIPECSYIVGLISLAGHYEGYQEDCDHIAAANPAVVLELVRRLRAAEADAKRLDFMVSDKCMMDSTPADSGGMRYWLSWPYSYTEQGTTFSSPREAIEAAIAAQGASHEG